MTFPSTRARSSASNSEIRADVVLRARRLLAQGYYDHTFVLDVAVARMISAMQARPRAGAPGRGAGRGVQRPDESRRGVGQSVPQHA